MGKPVKVYHVNNINKINVTRYVDGSLFITNKSISILQNGKIKKLSTQAVNLKDYVKRDEVEQIIKDYLKEGDTDEKKA